MYGYPIRDWPNPKPRGPLSSSHVSIEDHHRGWVAYLFRLDLPHWARHVSYLERFKGATGDPSVLKAAIWNTHPSRNKGSRNCFLLNGRKTHRCNKQCHHGKYIHNRGKCPQRLFTIWNSFDSQKIATKRQAVQTDLFLLLKWRALLSNCESHSPR